MDFKEIVNTRYATKAFDGKKIPEEKIDELIDYICLTPSALNLQPWRIMVISDQTLKDKLLPASFGQAHMCNCSHLLVLCADSDVAARIEKVSASMTAGGVPTERIEGMMGMAKGRIAAMETADRLAWAKCQVYLMLANAVNAAKALGFDSCPMTGFDPDQYATILDLPENLVATALCPVGYGADTPVPKSRLDKDDLLI